MKLIQLNQGGLGTIKMNLFRKNFGFQDGGKLKMSDACRPILIYTFFR